MVILLIVEKQAQKWTRNRFGCNIDKVREFKELDEKMKAIREQADKIKEYKDLEDKLRITKHNPEKEKEREELEHRLRECNIEEVI